jgi:acetylornithine deacetylase
VPSRLDPLAILEKLVSYRTDVTGGHERPLADHLAARLREARADEVVVADVPREDGKKAASYVYARYGHPRVLVNAHIDTVPPNAAWSSDPFVPRRDGDRLYALGAADTKGAIAAIVTALGDVTPKNVGILFSGVEEFSDSSVRRE